MRNRNDLVIEFRVDIELLARMVSILEAAGISETRLSAITRSIIELAVTGLPSLLKLKSESFTKEQALKYLRGKGIESLQVGEQLPRNLQLSLARESMLENMREMEEVEKLLKTVNVADDPILSKFLDEK